MTKSKRLAWLLSLPPDQRRDALKLLKEEERKELAHHWRLWARAEQTAPEGDWRLWLVLAGRGFGKTRAGAECIREVAADPLARIALVGASLGEVRAVMVEGESGLLAISPPRRRPRFEPSLRRLTWPNGALATLYSAGEPESLRGPQHSHARRPGAEGSLRQRGARAGRCAAALRDRRRSSRSAPRARRRGKLAGGRRRDGRMGRTGRQDRLPAGRELAVRHPG